MTERTGNSDSMSFGAFVAGHERVVDPLTLPIGLQALDLAGISAGDRFIDVAAGTGALALAVPSAACRSWPQTSRRRWSRARQSGLHRLTIARHE